jgi:hypothetical protein
MPNLAVRHSDLITHAGRVEATAPSAGRAVRAVIDAYGKLCAMVPVMLNALRDTGGRSRTAAEEQEVTDRHGAGAFRSIR